jgi:DNA-binding MarR family transcriptional regulator
LFGTVFVLVQNLSRRVDVALRPLGLTSRQWLLLAVLQRSFPHRSPSLTEAAAAYGSSRQNVKRIAEQLSRRGFLRLVADPSDRRPTRLELTERIDVLNGSEVSQAEFLLQSMSGLDDDQLRQLRDLALTWLEALSADPPSADESPADGPQTDDPQTPYESPAALPARYSGARSTTHSPARPAGIDVAAAERAALTASLTR